MPEGDSSPDPSSSGGESVTRPPTATGDNTPGLNSSGHGRIGKGLKLDGSASHKVSKSVNLASRIRDESGSESDEEDIERKLANLHNQVCVCQPDGHMNNADYFSKWNDLA